MIVYVSCTASTPPPLLESCCLLRLLPPRREERKAVAKLQVRRSLSTSHGETSCTCNASKLGRSTREKLFCATRLLACIAEEKPCCHDHARAMATLGHSYQGPPAVSWQRECALDSEIIFECCGQQTLHVAWKPPHGHQPKVVGHDTAICISLKFKTSISNSIIHPELRSTPARYSPQV